MARTTAQLPGEPVVLEVSELIDIMKMLGDVEELYTYQRKDADSRGEWDWFDLLERKADELTDKINMAISWGLASNAVAVELMELEGQRDVALDELAELRDGAVWLHTPLLLPLT